MVYIGERSRINKAIQDAGRELEEARKKGKTVSATDLASKYNIKGYEGNINLQAAPPKTTVSAGYSRASDISTLSTAQRELLSSGPKAGDVILTDSGGRSIAYRGGKKIGFVSEAQRLDYLRTQKSYRDYEARKNSLKEGDLILSSNVSNVNKVYRGGSFIGTITGSVSNKRINYLQSSNRRFNFSNDIVGLGQISSPRIGGTYTSARMEDRGFLRNLSARVDVAVDRATFSSIVDPTGSNKLKAAAFQIGEPIVQTGIAGGLLVTRPIETIKNIGGSLFNLSGTGEAIGKRLKERPSSIGGEILTGALLVKGGSLLGSKLGKATAGTTVTGEKTSTLRISQAENILDVVKSKSVVKSGPNEFFINTFEITKSVPGKGETLIQAESAFQIVKISKGKVVGPDILGRGTYRGVGITQGDFLLERGFSKGIVEYGQGYKGVVASSSTASQKFNIGGFEAQRGVTLEKVSGIFDTGSDITKFNPRIKLDSLKPSSARVSTSKELAEIGKVRYFKGASITRRGKQLVNQLDDLYGEFFQFNKARPKAKPPAINTNELGISTTAKTEQISFVPKTIARTTETAKQAVRSIIKTERTQSGGRAGIGIATSLNVGKTLQETKPLQARAAIQVTSQKRMQRNAIIQRQQRENVLIQSRRPLIDVSSLTRQEVSPLLRTTQRSSQITSQELSFSNLLRTGTTPSKQTKTTAPVTNLPAFNIFDIPREGKQRQPERESMFSYKGRYTASLVAAGLNIRGKAPKVLSGIGIRPVLK